MRLFVMATAMFATVIAASSLAATPPREPSKTICKHSGTTVRTNSVARIFRVRAGDNEIYICRYSSRKRPILIGLEAAPGASPSGVGGFQLAGSFAAYETAGCSRGDCPGDVIEVVDLSRRRIVPSLPATIGDRYVLKDNGSLAVISLDRGGVPGTLAVRRSDRTGSSVLDTGNIDPGSLALAGNRIYWIKDGQPQVAPID